MRPPMRTFRFAALAALVVSAQTAHAVPSTVVNDAGDGGPGNCASACTLRDAISASPSGGAITFAPGLASLITLSQGKLSVNKTLTIQGPGAAKLTISADNASQIFVVSAQVSISGLTLADGYVIGTVGSNGAPGTPGSSGVDGGMGGTGGTGGLAGGACVQVANTGALVLDHVAVRHCIAQGGPAGNAGNGGSGDLNPMDTPSAGGIGGNGGVGGDATGGAILVYGSLSLLNSSVVDGQVHGGAGGNGGAGGIGSTGGSPVFAASGVSGAGGAASGGAVFVAAGSLRVTNSTLANSIGVGGTGGAGVTSTSDVTSGGAGGAASGALIRVDASAALADVEFSTLAGGQVIGGNGGSGIAPPFTGPTGAAVGNAVSAVNTITVQSSVIVDALPGVFVCSGLVTTATGSVNLDEDGSCGATLHGSFAQLFHPLDVNATPWPGFQPLYHSAVINVAATCQDLAEQTVSVDQHDTPRPQGANCDLGAIEADYVFVDGFDE